MPPLICLHLCSKSTLSIRIFSNYHTSYNCVLLCLVWFGLVCFLHQLQVPYRPVFHLHMPSNQGNDWFICRALPRILSRIIGSIVRDSGMSELDLLNLVMGIKPGQVTQKPLPNCFERVLGKMFSSSRVQSSENT